MLTPTVCVAPVRSHSHAITTSWLAPAGPTSPATSISPIANADTIFISPSLGCPAPSVRERPDPEVIPDVPPQPVQPLRLHDQEEDDQRAEQDQAQVRDDVEHRGLAEDQAAEPLH